MGVIDVKAWRARTGRANHFGDRRRIAHKRFYAILRKYSLWKFAAPISSCDWSRVQRELGEVSETERIQPSKRWSQSSAIFVCDVEIALKSCLKNRPDLMREWVTMALEESFGMKPIMLPLKVSRLRSELAERAGKEFLKRDIGSNKYWHPNGRR